MLNTTVWLDVMTQDTCVIMGVCGGSVQTENINVFVHLCCIYSISNPKNLFTSLSFSSAQYPLFNLEVLVPSLPFSPGELLPGLGDETISSSDEDSIR